MHGMRSQAPDKGETMILLKIHADGVVSLCDSDLIGKTFSEGELQLEVKERFYKGKEAPKEKMIKAMQDAKTINLVGKESIQLAIDAKIITKDSVITIDKIPHAQVFTL